MWTSVEQVKYELWTSPEKFIYKLRSLVKTTIDDQGMNKSRLQSHEQPLNKSWTSHEQNVQSFLYDLKSRATHKSWTSNKQVMYKSWTRHRQGI